MMKIKIIFLNNVNKILFSNLELYFLTSGISRGHEFDFKNKVNCIFILASEIFITKINKVSHQWEQNINRILRLETSLCNNTFGF